MRVVFLTHNYPRHPGDIAGSFLHPLALALQARGVEIRVVAPSDAGRGGADLVDGIRVRRVRYAPAGQERWAYSGRMLRALGSARGVIALARLWEALRRGARAESGGSGALVHAHWWIPGGLASPPELPLVLTLHGTDGALLRRSAAARLLARPVLRRARIVTAVSSSLTEAAQRVVPTLAVPVQPMPVNPEGWEWSTGGGGVMVVNRLTAQKRVHLAIAAVNELGRRAAPVQLVIVGDGPERAALERQAQGVPAGAVRFTGALPHSEVKRLLASADLALQLGVGEGFGLAAVEALMSGVPVVVCEDGGGLLDIVRSPERGQLSPAGRIVPPTPEALADAMAAVLADPGARPAAREAGTEWRERLNPELVAARFHEWYHQALRV